MKNLFYSTSLLSELAVLKHSAMAASRWVGRETCTPSIVKRGVLCILCRAACLSRYLPGFKCNLEVFIKGGNLDGKDLP